MMNDYKKRAEGDNLLKINNFLLIANGDCIFSQPMSSISAPLAMSLCFERG